MFNFIYFLINVIYIENIVAKNNVLFKYLRC